MILRRLKKSQIWLHIRRSGPAPHNRPIGSIHSHIAALVAL
jgi:hypothetical protein